MKVRLGYIRFVSHADIDTAEQCDTDEDPSEDGNEDEEETGEDENECDENGIDESGEIESDDADKNSECADDNNKCSDSVEQLEGHCGNGTASDEINATNDSATHPAPSPTNRDCPRPDLLRIEPRPHRLSASSTKDSYDEPFDPEFLLDRQLQLVAFHDMVYHRRILKIPSTEPQHYPFAEPMQWPGGVSENAAPAIALKSVRSLF